MRSYDDIILGRIDEAEMCLENEWFIAALTLALTLPDICGKAEYPDETVTARYIQWFNTYVKPYDKPKSKLSEDMPYLSGEVVYNSAQKYGKGYALCHFYRVLALDERDCRDAHKSDGVYYKCSEILPVHRSQLAV